MPHDTAPNIEHIGTDRETERELYVLELATPDDLPRSFNTAGKYSTVLIVWDAADVGTDSIFQFARHLIDAGAVYFCAWGPDCERVHDLIDEEWVGDGSTPATDPTLMTTWHDDDSLAEAIWFALYTALPGDAYFDECRSVIAICIGCPQWAAEVRSAFSDSKRFSEELLGPDD